MVIITININNGQNSHYLYYIQGGIGMKNKRNLSLMLVYVFLLTILPINFLVQQVKADSSTVQNNNVKHDIQKLYTMLVDQYGDSNLLIAADETNNNKTAKIVKLNSDGTSKTIKTNITDVYKGYLGAANGKAYYYNYGANGGAINSVDLDNGTDQKAYDVQIPNGYAIKSIYRECGTRIKDGTIILNCYKNSDQYSKRILLTIRNGKQSIIDTSTQGIDRISDCTIDNKGNIWAITDGNYDLIKIDSNNNISPYNLNLSTGYRFCKEHIINVDAQDNIWTNAWYQDKYQTSCVAVKISQSGTGVTSTLYGLDKGLTDCVLNSLTVDKNGNEWVSDDGRVKELVNDKFVEKYAVPVYQDMLSVVDENHLVAADYERYIYIRNTAPTPVEPNNGGNSETTQNQDTTGGSTVTPDTKISVTPQVTQNNGSAVVTVNGSTINRDATNVIAPALTSDTNSVETKIGVAVIKDGKGNLELKSGSSDVVLPIGAVDFTGAGDGAYLSVKQIVNTTDPILKAIKGVSKLFEFDAAIYDKNGNKIKDIHQFNGSYKAKVTLKLTADDIKGLDTTKLAAFYYNESTGKFENLGGSYDSTSKTFTLETPHFSKYVLGAADASGAILPQTGSVIDMTLVMGIALIMIAAGAVIVLKKEKTAN